MAPIVALTVVEQLINGAFLSTTVLANNSGQFTVQLVSSAWELVPGIVVTAALEQSRDNGATWTHMAGIETETGPIPAPPRDTLPFLIVGYPDVKGNRRLRLRLTTSAPLLLGATVAVD